ncbi:MAG: HAMP domain-containing sensor histidine kinase [Verrucomicrobiota bacterium]
MRRRLIWTFALFSIGLTTLFGCIIIFVYQYSEDWTYRKQLAEVMANAATGVEDYRLAEVSSEHAFDELLGVRITDLEDGYHEFNLPLEELEVPEEIHLLIESRPNGTRQVAIIRTPEQKTMEVKAGLVVWSVVISFAIIGVVIGIILAYRSVRPIKELTAWLRKGDPSGVPPQWLSDSETRLLAKSLEQYLVQRTSQLDRERAFLREASHELRNPINIVKGVSELAEEQPLTPEGLKRIQRSVQRMENTVGGLLALARKEQKIEGASMEEEWSAMLDEYREGFDGTITDSKEWDPIEPLTVRMIVITSGALLHNALQHAEATSISVRLTNESLVVGDNGRGVNDLAAIRDSLDSGHPLPGGGQGLALVTRICRRMEWTLSLENKKGLNVEIVF